jgi:hypothetical protein
MNVPRADLLSLLCFAALLPVGCGGSGRAVSHDGALPLADARSGSGGGTTGAGGTGVGGVSGTGGATIGTGGMTIGTGGMGGMTVGTGGTVVGTGATVAGTGGTFAGTGATGSGGSGAGHDAGVDASLSGDVGGGTGGRWDGGSGGTPGFDSPTVASCPSAPPRDGDSCGATQPCYYEDCAGAGRAVAACVQDRWTVTVAPCMTAVCRSGSVSTSCEAGRLCLAIASGSPVALCAPNTCGTGPVSCSCLQSCTGVCTVSGTAANGLVVSCNPCPPGGCV